MKKLITLLIVLMVIPVAFAQEPEIKAGINPSAGILYDLDVWFDEMKVNAVKDYAGKARIRIEIAEERAMEMEQMAIKNQIQFMEEARLEHQKNIAELDEITDEIDSDEEKNDIQARFQKHIMNLERVKAQVPEQAKAGINTAITNANQHFERQQIKISVANRMEKSEIRTKVDAGEIMIKSNKGGR